MPKKETADSVLAHTEAKLQFYTKYLERYLQILLAAKDVNKINIYDLYCGAGRYSDGQTGSAVRAVEAVSSAQAKITTDKVINLHLNDLNAAKVKKLRNLLAGKDSSEKQFFITFSRYEAFDLLKKIASKLPAQDRHTRNLIFIDPYGYKDIDKENLEAVLVTGRTELVLFLPIEQMYRFRLKAIDDEVDNPYIPLKNFIEQFELDVTKITSEKEFIVALESALKFQGKFFTASYSIRNHNRHLYGMFFITSHLYGLEKIVEVKWELDSQKGQGFTGENQLDIFLETDRLSVLRKAITALVSNGEADNLTLYELVIRKGFLPKHGNNVLRELCAEEVLYAIDAVERKSVRKGAYKLNYKEYKSRKPSVFFREGPGKKL
ncbi:three-Cys-motif partner protein TcmP [Hahella sp. CR1]|uniref:three-Cys-motif partner protein TcmP n=1 Tax=Hahella sp. CR1 TaxID=2992807 RepID=UPI0024424C98|nr:three-Cys-motif partner protein TcmP [Hahella sp. CR1]MDG9667717.1 three-Cys-motif partner protein TcmP [Hahella sp. CR1]